MTFHKSTNPGALAPPPGVDLSSDEPTDAERQRAYGEAQRLIEHEIWPLCGDLLLTGSAAGLEGLGASGAGEGEANSASEGAGSGAGDITKEPGSVSSKTKEGDGGAVGSGADPSRTAERDAPPAAAAKGHAATLERLKNMLDAGQLIETAVEITLRHPSEAEVVHRKGTVGYLGTDDVSFDAEMQALEQRVRQRATKPRSEFFSDAILLQEPGYHEASARADALAKLRANGENNEPAALKLAGEMLETSEATEQVVLFLTDGGAVNDCKACVEQTERETGIRIIGIGIGAGCGKVPHIYRDHVVVPTIENLPLKMADVLRQALSRDASSR